MTAIEALPAEWDADRDEPFFRLVADLFSVAFTAGASVLLASNADEPAPRATGPVVAARAYRPRHSRQRSTS